jgi:hypothetical protein
VSGLAAIETKLDHEDSARVEGEGGPEALGPAMAAEEGEEDDENISRFVD